MSFVLALIALAAAALLAGMETGLYATSRLRIVLDAAAGHPAAKRVQALLTELPVVLAVLLLATNLVNWALSALAQSVLVRAGVEQAELVGTLLVTAVVFVLGESVPKELFRRAQHQALYACAPALQMLRAVLGPVLLPVVRLSGWLAARLARPSVAASSSSERDALLRAGAAEGLLSPFQKRVADGVLSLRLRRAADEARPVEAYPLARLGQAGVQVPEGSREYLVLVLDEAGGRVAGWMALAGLYEAGRFRAPVRRELQPVARVEPGTGLDRVYAALDRSGTPFAALVEDGPLRVVDSARLRQRLMAGTERPRPSVATASAAP
jgi:CBS domain containing-hemolysin-like protein